VFLRATAKTQISQSMHKVAYRKKEKAEIQLAKLYFLCSKRLNKNVLILKNDSIMYFIHLTSNISQI